MSYGRFGKKDKDPPAPPSLPLVEQVVVDSPLGNRTITEQIGSTQIVRQQLTPETQRLLDTSQRQVNLLASTLGQVDGERAAQIRRQSQGLFSDLAGAINASADDSAARIRSDNARRFGGSTNSTFGTQLLSELEGQRQSSLAGAARDALNDADNRIGIEQNRQLQRLGAFTNLLSGFDSAASFAGAEGLNTLGQSQGLAASRANALNNFSLNQERLRQNRNQAFTQRLRTLNDIYQTNRR